LPQLLPEPKVNKTKYQRSINFCKIITNLNQIEMNYLLFADFDNSANNAQYSDFGIAYAPDQDGNVPEQQLSPVGLAFQRFALTQIWVIE
jgi:hypothetical protein